MEPAAEFKRSLGELQRAPPFAFHLLRGSVRHCARSTRSLCRSTLRDTAKLRQADGEVGRAAGAHSGRSQRALTALAPIRIANVSKPHRPFANLECDFRNSGHPVLDDLPGTLLALRAHLPDGSKQVLNSDQAFLACCRRSVLLHRHATSLLQPASRRRCDDRVLALQATETSTSNAIQRRSRPWPCANSARHHASPGSPGWAPLALPFEPLKARGHACLCEPDACDGTVSVPSRSKTTPRSRGRAADAMCRNGDVNTRIRSRMTFVTVTTSKVLGLDSDTCPHQP